MRRGILVVLCMGLPAATNLAARDGSSSMVTGRALVTNEENRGQCSSQMFKPNYADEIGALRNAGWKEFPIRTWIDGSTVHDEEELRGLKEGLKSWSDATHGVLGVRFVKKRMDAQVEVRMVSSLPSARSSLLRLGSTVLEMEDEVPTHAHLQILHVTPALLKAVGGGANSLLTRALLIQRTAGHEMGHMLMGNTERHPKEASAILRQGDVGVLRPGTSDINTAKAKYCELFGVVAKEDAAR